MPGVLVGTFSDYGAFDECLDVQAPRSRNREDGFRGSSCSVQFKPPYPRRPPSFTVAKGGVPDDTDTLSGAFRVLSNTISHKWFRIVACVPSKCSLQDMRLIAQKLSNMSSFDIRVPKCYVKEDPELQPVHVAVLVSLSMLLTMCLIGTMVDTQCQQQNKTNEMLWKKVLLAFSLPTNLRRLLAPSGGATELKCIHGIRALSMCWIILGHTYVMLNLDLVKSQIDMQSWFSLWQFEIIGNGWISVEPFFLISGVLVSYGGMKSMKKLNGFKSLPLIALRRYIRLTPPLLLMMGMFYFLPLVCSGPFWHEHIDETLDSCRDYWWSTLLYISNWLGMRKGCVVSTWYLAADFQLHIFSFILLIVVIRNVKIGMSALLTCIAVSCIAVGFQTFRHNLPPQAQASTADDKIVTKVLEEVHILTVTHLAPYCVGMILGYYLHKYKEQKIKKWILAIGWCSSVIMSISAVLGTHRFATGDETSRYAAILYASVHRTVLAVGVAWVIFACIIGNGGPVNAVLSSPILAPLSRLTFMAYLIHPLVIWTRNGSLRERPVTWHYDFVYSYFAHLMTTFALAIPFYLILEAPLSNIDRIVFSRSQERVPKKDNNLSPNELSWKPTKEVKEHVNVLSIVRTPL